MRAPPRRLGGVRRQREARQLRDQRAGKVVAAGSLPVAVRRAAQRLPGGAAVDARDVAGGLAHARWQRAINSSVSAAGSCACTAAMRLQALQNGPPKDASLMD